IELICDKVVILNKGSVLKQSRVSELTVNVQTGELIATVRADENAIRHALEGTTLSITETTAEGVTASIVVTSQEDIDSAVDRLRAANISIVNMTPRRQTLEEAFL